MRVCARARVRVRGCTPTGPAAAKHATCRTLAVAETMDAGRVLGQGVRDYSCLPSTSYPNPSPRPVFAPPSAALCTSETSQSDNDSGKPAPESATEATASENVTRTPSHRRPTPLHTFAHAHAILHHEHKDDQGLLGLPNVASAMRYVEYFAVTGQIVLPKRIILVRHGESLGNADEKAYVDIPDWRIPLTKRGKLQSQKTGQIIKEIIKDDPVYVYTSPYLRTKQTLAGMIHALEENHIVGVREEPRLTEQQFGNFQNVSNVREAKEERGEYGRFYYRFSQGESGLDVYNRVTSFIATLFRDFANDDIKRQDLNVIMVTHGLTLRLFLMRWFQYTVNDFEDSINPPNGGIVIMERTENEQKASFELLEESLDLLKFPRHHTWGSLWKILRESQEEGHVPKHLRHHLSKVPKVGTMEDAGSIKGFD